MKKLIASAAVSVITCCSANSYSTEEKFAVACPIFKTEELKSMGPNHIVTSGGHKWYVQDVFDFELQEGRVINMPLGLTADDLVKTKEVSLLDQLDSHTCQYKLELESGRQAKVTFKLVGD